MQINFEREGGYANLPIKYIVDTDELPQNIAKRLLESIKTSGVWVLQQEEQATKPHVFPDMFSYRLTLSEGGRRKYLSFTDITAPESLRPMLDILQELALDQTLKGNVHARLGTHEHEN
jgi:hypothetical protein